MKSMLSVRQEGQSKMEDQWTDRPVELNDCSGWHARWKDSLWSKSIILESDMRVQLLAMSGYTNEKGASVNGKDSV